MNSDARYSECGSESGDSTDGSSSGDAADTVSVVIDSGVFVGLGKYDGRDVSGVTLTGPAATSSLL